MHKISRFILENPTIDVLGTVCYTIIVRQRTTPLNGRREVMEEVNTTEALLRAILELIAKCETLTIQRNVARGRRCTS